MIGDGSPQSNHPLDHTCSEATLVESEDGQAEASDARFQVCFVGSVHYSQPLDATSAKKFRSLETIGRIFVVGFATSLRPVWFKDGASSFFLLPSLASPVFRYLMLYSAGLVVTLNWILVHGVTVIVTQGPYEGLCGAVAKQISRLFGKRVALLVESHGDFEQDLFCRGGFASPDSSDGSFFEYPDSRYAVPMHFAPSRVPPANSFHDGLRESPS